MPDTSKLDSFAIADVDVHDGDLVVIVGPGEIVEIEDQRTKERLTKLRIKITCPSGDTKELTLNSSSRRALAEGYGKNSEDWEGKNALVTVVTKDVFGQFKKVIYLNPVKGGR